MAVSRSIRARALVPGVAAGRVLALAEPLSLWGGLDPQTGRIIDRRHPRCGEIVTSAVCVLPWGRGSSSSSSVLLEAVRCHTAPAAFLLLEVDGILALGAVVARELYHLGPPVLVLQSADYESLVEGEEVEITEEGMVTVRAGRRIEP